MGERMQYHYEHHVLKPAVRLEQESTLHSGYQINNLRSFLFS